MPNYELIQHPNGTSSLKDLRNGEAMHSHIGPWEEAQTVYIGPSRLVERLRSRSVVLWDVGMGTASNALAAIEAVQQGSTEAHTADEGDSALHPLEIWSFESDLDGLRSALAESHAFPFFQEHGERARALVEQGRWKSAPLDRAQITWNCLEGDFFELFDRAADPDLVFYDFYAPKSCPNLWDKAAFCRLFERTARHRALGLPTWLHTYSSATPVRMAMIEGGFEIARGPRTPVKRETTIACSLPGHVEAPLGAEWMAHKRKFTQR